MNRYLNILFFLTTILVLSCEQESPTVHVELQSFLDKFSYEAEKRNVPINTEQLSAWFEDIEESQVLGKCVNKQSGPLILIDETFWKSSNYYKKELVIFHELGHCILGREHDDSKRRNNCHSIMNSGTSGCSIRYNSNTRSTYLDELFNN